MKSKKADWQDQHIFAVNKRKPVVMTPSYFSFDEAKAGDHPITNIDAYDVARWPHRILLNGEWSFKLVKGVNNCSLDFEKMTQTLTEVEESFDRISVPGVWQLQGYHESDPPYYFAFGYPDAVSTKKIPFINDEKNTVGCYFRTFNITEEKLYDRNREDEKGNKVKNKTYLHFGAVKSAFYLYMNGQYVGYSQGSMTPAEFDVSNYVVTGENKIGVKVLRFSDGTYLEDQDMWFLSGIYRDVFIYFEPALYIEDIFARTEKEENGYRLVVNGSIVNSTFKAQAIKIGLYLADNMDELNEQCITKAGMVVDLVDSESWRLEAFVERPKEWTAETPKLYYLGVEVSTPTGKVLQIKVLKIGFRTIEIDGELLKLNGVPIKLHGVNRHEFHSDFGYACPKETILRDLLHIKSININAVRTSHYPNSDYFYQVCNEIGLYVMDEADIETHGVRNKGIPGSYPEWTGALLDRIERMVIRDRNYPCVIAWSLGNEAGFGSNFVEMKKRILEIDDSRFIHYEGDTELTVSDIFSRMYASPDFIRKTGQKEDLSVSFFQKFLNRFAQDNKPFKKEQYMDKPIMYCEFAHAMGNSLGNFKEHIDGWYRFKNWCGGFIWDYVDQSIHRVENEKDQWLYGGDFGEGKSHTYFCGNGIVSGSREIHPAANEVKKCYQYMLVENVDIEEGIVNITNRYSFTDLNALLWAYELLEDGAVIQNGVIDSVSVRPFETKTVHIPLEPFRKEIGVHYHVNLYFVLKEDSVFEKAGYILGMHQIEMEKIGVKEFNFVSEIPVSHRDKKLKLEVFSTEFSASISKATGDITSLRIGAFEVLKKPMTLNFWRPITDNDRGLSNFVPGLKWLFVDEQGKYATQNYKVHHYKVEEDYHGIKVHMYRTVNGFKGFVDTTYHFDGEGNVDISMKGTPLKPLVKFGVSFGADIHWSSYLYFGRGPHENYCDRKYSAHMGIYESNTDDFIHHYLRPQENGNRTDVKWFMLESPEQEGLLIEATSDPGLEISVWPYTQTELDTKEHIHELERSDYLTVNVDYRQQGVGGDYPGEARRLKEYTLPAKKEYSYSFRLIRN